MEGKKVNIVNVYSPCYVSHKRRLWNDLKDLVKDEMEARWCILEDFNTIRYESERKEV